MVNKLVTTVIIGTTLMGLGVGSVEVSAQEGNTPVISISDNIQFEDIRTTINIEPIIGKDSHQHDRKFDGEYTVYKTHDMVKDGSTIELEEPKLIGKYEGNSEVRGLDAGEYTIVNTKPSTGYLVDRQEYRYSLPLMEDGVIVEDQTVNFKPKLTPVDLVVEFTKKGEDEDLLEGVVFEFERVGEEAEEFKTDDLGKITLTGLTTGEYLLREKETVEGYMLDSREIKIKVKYDEEGEPIIETDYGEMKYVSSNDEEGTLEMTNFYQPKIQNEADTNMGESSIETIAESSVLGEVSFTFMSMLPTNIEEYEEYVIMNIFDDVMKADGEPRLVLDGEVELVKGRDYKTVIEGQEMTINLTLEGIQKAEGKKELTVEQGSRVDLESLVDVVLAEKEVKNKVILEVDNGSGNVVTFDDEVSIILKEGAVQLTKVDGDNERSLLKGAKFRLEKKVDGEYIPVEVNERFKQINESNKTYLEEDGVVHLETGRKGSADILGLEFGEYRLVEVQAPKGYEINKEPVEFVVEDIELGDRAIKDVEDSVGVVVENFAIKDYPKTGTWNNIMIVIVMISGVATVAYIQTKKEDEELEG